MREDERDGCQCKFEQDRETQKIPVRKERSVDARSVALLLLGVAGILWICVAFAQPPAHVLAALAVASIFVGATVFTFRRR